MKFCGKFSNPVEIQTNSEDLVKKLVSDKWERYRGNDVLVPSEHYEVDKNFAKNQSKQLSNQSEQFRKQGNFQKADELQKQAEKYKQVAKDLKNSGLTSKEALFLREHPKLATAKFVTQTANRSGLEHAKSAAVIAGSISIVQNIALTIKGDKELKEATKDVLKTTADASATAYLTGAGDTIIRSVWPQTKTTSFKHFHAPIHQL